MALIQTTAIKVTNYNPLGSPYAYGEPYNYCIKPFKKVV